MSRLHISSADPETQRITMLETPIPPLVLTLAFPTILSMLVTSIYNMADTYFVSQINTSASAAVGVLFPIMTIIQAVGFMVGMGSGSIISRLLGKNMLDKANVYAASAVLMAFVLGTALAVCGIFALGALLWILGSTPTIYPYAMDYGLYIVLGAPVMILSYTLNNLLRWQGRASLSVIGLATGGVLNMVLDPIFIFLFHWGIGGAGAATLLSQCVSLAILFLFFIKRKSTIQISPRFISRTPRIYGEILKQGMPSFFRQAVLSLGTISLNFNARIFEDAAVAAMAIVSKVFLVANSIIIGFGQGFQPVLGYNYGVGNYARVKESILFALKICTGVLLVVGIAAYIFAAQIIFQFRRDDAAVLAIGTQALRFQCVTLWLLPTLTYANMVFQSLGKSRRASLLAICRQGLFIPLVFILRSQFGLVGLESAQMVADLLATVIAAPILFHFFRFELGREPLSP